jgi:hypothetical protein
MKRSKEIKKRNKKKKRKKEFRENKTELLISQFEEVKTTHFLEFE